MSFSTVYQSLFGSSRPRRPAQKCFRPRVEELESRIVPSTLDGNGPVVTGLSATPGNPSLTITFDGPLSLPGTGNLAASDLAFFKVNQLAAGANPELITTNGPAVSILSGTYASTGTFSSQVTLNLGSALTSGVFYRIYIDGSPTIANSAAVVGTALFGGTPAKPTNPLDGDNDDTATGDFYGLFAVGDNSTSLHFTDSLGAQVSLGLTGPGAINVWRELDGDIDQLSVLGAVSGTTLTGSATKAVYVGSKTIPVASAFSLGGAADSLSASFITPIAFTGTTTLNSNSITVTGSDLSALKVGQSVVGADIPVAPGTVIAAMVTSGTTSTITLNQPAQATGTLPLAAFADNIIAAGFSGTIGATDSVTQATTIAIPGGTAGLGLAAGQQLVDSTGNASGTTIPPGATIYSVASNSITFTSAPPGAPASGTAVALTAFTPYLAPTPAPKPAVATSQNLPYTLSVEPITTSVTALLPGIQGADYIQVAPTVAYPSGLWVVLGGRTNGLHNFTTGGVTAFPPDLQNLDIFVINPANWQVLKQVPWSSTDVPASTYQSLVSVAQEEYQNGDTVYAVGGYSAPISDVFTASTTLNSNVITVTGGDIAALAIGQAITQSDSQATGPIPQGASIIAISGTTITLNEKATATTLNVSLTAFSDTIVTTPTFTGDASTGSQTISSVSSTTSLAGGQTLTDSANAIPAGSVINTVGPGSITFTQPLLSTQVNASSNQTGDTITASYTNFTTWGTLSSFSASGLANALLNPVTNGQGQIEVAGAAAVKLQQISDPRLRVTGGGMNAINGVTYLAVGQDFEGGYFGPTNVQTYSDKIQSFVISNSPTLSIGAYQALRDPVNFRRRDGNMGAVIQPNGQEGLSIFGGVFSVPGGLGYGNPIVLGGAGPTAQVNTAYSQIFSQYNSANIPLFDTSTGSMYTVFLGGIGLYDYPNYPTGPLSGPNTDLPWINDVTSFMTNAAGTNQEYIMPPIPSLTSSGTGFYGAESGFFASPGLPTYSNGVIQLDQLKGPTVVGYMYGGIHSLLPLTNNSITQTGASNQVFAIVLTPTSPLPANQVYVDNLYSLLLHRPADAGAQGWINALNAGAAPASVVLGIERSPEYLNDEVTALYQQYLRRAPDPSAQGWVTALKNGATIEQVIDGIVASAEFFNVEGGGTNAGYATALYQYILNRAPDTAGYNGWLNALNTGTSPSAVAMAFLNSTEYRTDLVDSYYSSYLGRPAEPNGLAAWLAALQAGTPDQQVLAGILGSAEGYIKWS